MCPEESEIEDPCVIKIDWLMDTKELEIRDIEDKSVAMNDVSVVFFGNQSWFFTNSEWQRKEEEENSGSQSLEDKVRACPKM